VSQPEPIQWNGAALQALHVEGVNERWNAVQEQLHPILVALSEQLDIAATRQFPNTWGLYEVSAKTVRAVNRGRQRDPIDDYHVVIDRPPRGCHIYLGVSGSEERILVGIQLWNKRKRELAAVWDRGRVLWEPLIRSLPDVRYTRGDHAEQQLWLDDYLANRSSNYLWAGWSYPWQQALDDSQQFNQQLINHMLALLPLNEAIMEIAEEEWELPPSHIREARPRYATGFNSPSIEEISASIRQRGFIYPDAVLRSYHIALQTKPLVILPGISGTGKTRLTRVYADAVHQIAPHSDNPYYLAVAVQPDWHNARDLLGYFNALTQTFQPTPTLRLLLRASADPANPYFLCLDELNLARPEYYLAPILSALETAEHLIDLGIPQEVAQTVDGESVRNPLRLPLNVHIIGTVNVDESTFTLSDKLLDRANVIELTEVDLAAWRASYRRPFNPTAWQLLLELQPILASLGHPFGYRTVEEIGRYLEGAEGIMPLNTALDLQIKQKLLPKLRGDDSPRFRNGLRSLAQLFAEYPQSQAKIQAMLERLDREGFADFY